MTRRKHFKQLVRERMRKTGESYATARRHVIGGPAPSAAPDLHMPGNVPGSTALRVLLGAAGVGPLSEAMVFGIAGGIGAGVFAFHYEKEDFSSFFVAGRHLWQDDLAYVSKAAPRLGATLAVRETAGRAAAERHLVEALSGGRPAMAWLDMAHLPYRAMPASWSGGGYHVVVVYGVDEASGAARVGDLADAPFTVEREALAEARGRIKAQKHRLVTLERTGALDLEGAVWAGLGSCVDGLVRQRQANFTVEAFRTWGERLHGAAGREAWERVFPPGRRLWRGLTSIYDFVEHYGTGGGLTRPLFAEFLSEAAGVVSDPGLAALAGRYGEIGRGWSALAEAALPDAVPALAEAKALLARKAELFASGGTPEEISAAWSRLDALSEEAGREFPLSDAEAGELRAGLAARVLDLYAAEVAALDELRAAVEGRAR